MLRSASVEMSPLTNAALDGAPLAIDAVQFAKTQEIAWVIGTILRRLHCYLLIFAREGGKLQGLQVIAQKHLGRNRREGRGLAKHRHAGAPAVAGVESTLAMRLR